MCGSLGQTYIPVKPALMCTLQSQVLTGCQHHSHSSSSQCHSLSDLITISVVLRVADRFQFRSFRQSYTLRKHNNCILLQHHDVCKLIGKILLYLRLHNVYSCLFNIMQTCYRLFNTVFICHSFRCTNEWCQTLICFVITREFADRFQLRSSSYMSLHMKDTLASVQNDIIIMSCFNMDT